MYSFTRSSIDCQLASTQSGIRNVVRITNSIEMPSTPTLYLIGPSHAYSSTNWKAGVDASKFVQMRTETPKVTIVVHSATQRALLAAAFGSVAMNSAPTSGRNVTIERIGWVVMVISESLPQSLRAPIQ